MKSRGLRNIVIELTSLLDVVMILIFAVMINYSNVTAQTEEDYKETYRFVNEMEFDRLGVFEYSPEENTPAYDLKPQISDEEKKRRRDELYELQQAVSFETSQELIGRTFEVLIDGYMPDDDVYVGRTYRDAPDIDGMVFVYSDRELMTGDMVSVTITDAKEYDLEGKLTDEPAQ